jgi:hypothetical protein
MQDASLQAQLLESKAEITRLRERLSMGTPTVHKDLALISLMPKWPGPESAVSLEEFFESTESAAKIGRWHASDCLQIAALKLTDSARIFYNTCLELHAEDTTWEIFKKAFRERFRDVRTDQYHFMQLQMARQGKHEGPQEFADRCRALAQKVICKDSDLVAQRIHRENADRMLLASFVAGLSGKVGKQVKFQNPQDQSQALTIALTVTEALKQEKLAETFYAKLEKSVRLSTRQDDREFAERHSPKRAATHPRARRYARGAERSGTSRSAREAQHRWEPRCYECEGRGHLARECPTRQKRERTQNAPGRKNPSERSNRSRSPGDEPRHTRGKETNKGTKNQGNV